MADIALKLYADAAQAEKEFQSFIGSSEKVKAAVEKFQKSFDPKQIDDFIAKNKLAALGVSQAQGPMKGLTAETKGYEKEIRKLISSGLSPQSAEIQKLRGEYDTARGKLDQLTAATKGQNKAFQNSHSTFSSGIKSLMSYAAAYVSLRGAIAAVKGLTNGLAEQGDEAAKTGRRVGLTAESYQELKYAADMAGVSGEKFASSMEKFTKSLGEAKAGTGALTTYLNKANPEFLKQIKNAHDSEEAFAMIADKMNGIKDPAEKAALATAAFGRSGMGMINMAEGGSAAINKLREEAKKYGFVISDEAAAASEEFLDEQTRLGKVLQGLVVQIGSPLLVPLTNAIKGFIEWATTGDNLKDTLKTVGTVIASVGAGVVAYLAITKGAVIATKLFTVATAAFNAVMSLNPIGLIVIGITALTFVIIKMVKHWDLVKYKVVDFVLAARQKMLELQLTIQDKVLGAVVALANKMSELPFIGEKFKKIADSQKEVIAETRNSIVAVEAARAAHQKEYEQLKTQKTDSIVAIQNEKNAVIESNKEISRSYEDRQAALKEMLNGIQLSEAAQQEQLIQQTANFFEQRAEMEGENFEERMEYLLEQREQLLAAETLTAEQRIAIEEGVTRAAEMEQRKQTAARVKFASLMLNQTGSLLTDLQTIFKNAGKESKALAIALRVVSAAEAAINSYLAYTKALASFPPPFNFAIAGVTLAAGLAKQAAILSTPIPSGQTGLEYTVPDLPSTRNDGAVARASAGEQVTITPRGEETSGGYGTQTINIDIGEDNLFRVIQRGIDTGKINLSNKNITGGVFA
jgi:hypothetical protein